MVTYFSKNYQNFKIYFTFLLFWFSTQFDDIFEDSLAYFLVLTVGLLHGANDILIISSNKKGKKLLVKNLLVYALISTSCIFIYWLNSYAAILLFIVISSYHFGEEHLSEKFSVNPFFDTLYFVIFGLNIFNMIFLTSLTDVNKIMLEITNSTFLKEDILLSLLISISITVVLTIYLILKKKVSMKMFALELFYMMFLFLVFKTTSLILGFAIYFIFWHSIPSMMHQIRYISNTVNNKSFFFYVKKAAPYWLVSVLGLVLLYIILPQVNLFASFVFVLLFAVTAPHIWVMYKMKN